jgi:hypothetical protein
MPHRAALHEAIAFEVIQVLPQGRACIACLLDGIIESDLTAALHEPKQGLLRIGGNERDVRHRGRSVVDESGINISRYGDNINKNVY